jgi:signal transduction histidine kinase
MTVLTSILIQHIDSVQTDGAALILLIHQVIIAGILVVAVMSNGFRWFGVCWTIGIILSPTWPTVIHFDIVWNRWGLHEPLAVSLVATSAALSIVGPLLIRRGLFLFRGQTTPYTTPLIAACITPFFLFMLEEFHFFQHEIIFVSIIGVLSAGAWILAALAVSGTTKIGPEPRHGRFVRYSLLSIGALTIVRTLPFTDPGSLNGSTDLIWIARFHVLTTVLMMILMLGLLVSLIMMVGASDRAALERSNEQLTKFAQATKLVTSRLGPTDFEIEYALTDICQASIRAIECDFVCVWRSIDGVMKVVEGVSNTRWGIPVGTIRHPHDLPVYFDLVRVGQMIRSDNLSMDAGLAMEEYAADNAIGAMIEVPVLLDGELSGTLCFGSTSPRIWNPAEISFAEAMAAALRLAVETFRRRSAVQEIVSLAKAKEAALTERNDVLTRLVAAERHMRKVEKMATHRDKLHSLGEMAGQLTHEINNFVHPLPNLLKGLRQDMDTDAFNARMSTAQKLVGSAKEILARYLRFAKVNEADPNWIDANQSLDNSLSLCKTILTSPKVLIQDVDLPKGVRFYGHDNGLAQILVNLTKNAMDAIADDGVIKISARTTDLSHNTVVHDHLKSPLTLLIEVADNGSGMDREVMERCFLPAFSTKVEDGQVTSGLGMGLAITARMVHSWGGEIKVSSEPDVGTVFFIYLRAAEVDQAS